MRQRSTAGPLSRSDGPLPVIQIEFEIRCA